MTDQTQPSAPDVVARLKSAGAWTRGSYDIPSSTDCERDSAPFEAADIIMMQAREIEALRAQVSATPKIKAAVTEAAPGCRHARYSLDVHEQVGTCLDCGAEGRMQFVVTPKIQAPVAGAPIAYLYSDAAVPRDAHPWLHSTMLVLAADRRPGLPGEVPLYAAPQPVAQPLGDDALEKLRQADGGRLNFVTLRGFRAVARAIEAAHNIGSAGGEG